MGLQKKFRQAIKGTKRVLISTHLYPDADGIGGQVALCLALREHGIDTHCVNEEILPKRYRHLDAQGVIFSHKQFERVHGKDGPLDLFILVDASSLSRIGKQMEKTGKKAKNILFIDHHPCTKEIAAIHCIDSHRAATGEIIGELIEGLGIKFSKEMAEALYAAILTDTNCFRYPSVSSQTHHLIAKLMDSGVKAATSYKNIYGTKKIKHIQLLGKILGSVKTTKNGKIAWFAITEKLLHEYDADAEDTHSFINHLLILDCVEVVCVFRQMRDQTKLSLRSAGTIDVGTIAEALGGGGHYHSAATLVKGAFREVIKESINKIQLMIR